MRYHFFYCKFGTSWYLGTMRYHEVLKISVKFGISWYLLKYRKIILNVIKLDRKPPWNIIQGEKRHFQSFIWIILEPSWWFIHHRTSVSVNFRLDSILFPTLQIGTFSNMLCFALDLFHNISFIFQVKTRA